MAAIPQTRWWKDIAMAERICQLADNRLNGLVDRKKWSAALRKEEINRKALKATSDRWDDVRKFVRS
jgi:hypothetical protein